MGFSKVDKLRMKQVFQQGNSRDEPPLDMRTLRQVDAAIDALPEGAAAEQSVEQVGRQLMDLQDREQEELLRRQKQTAEVQERLGVPRFLRS